MSLSEIIGLITFINPLVLFIGIGIGIFYFSQLSSLFKWLVIYLIVALIFDFSSRYIGTFYKNNLILIPAFALVDLSFFTVIYSKFLIKKNRHYFSLPFLLLSLFILYEIIVLRKVDAADFQSYSRIFVNFYITLLSIIYYVNNLTDLTVKSKDKMKLNQIILMYFTLSLVLFLPNNFTINTGMDLKFYIWLLILLITLLFYIFITLQIWRNGKTQK